MAGGHMTGLAWAGISGAWEEAQANKKAYDAFDDMAYERERRQRMMDRIRAEERREGRELHSAKEDKYDRWIMGQDFAV